MARTQCFMQGSVICTHWWLFHYVWSISLDEEVRECVLLSLDEKFDTHLAQAENLTSLFIALYDGVSPSLSRIEYSGTAVHCI